MLVTLALSPSAKIAIVLMVCIVVFPLTGLVLNWHKKHRRRVWRRLHREVWTAHESVLAGLRQMADVFAELPAQPRELSRQGVHLVDAQARAADAFQKLCRRSATMSRKRGLRLLSRECRRFHQQEALFSTFRDRVLRAVSDQARRGVIAPPAPRRCYRAVFTVLKHELPEEHWPAVNDTLARGVHLHMQGVDGEWHPVPLKFTGGGQAAFSRKFLERAVALKMTIGHENAAREVFDYRVSHSLPVKPMRPAKQRVAKLLSSWRSAFMPSST